MLRKNVSKSCLVLILLFSSALACSTTEARELHIAAAASLLPAFTELGKSYEQQTGEKLLLTYSSTGALTEQIRNGAPFDVFASADRKYITSLVKEGLLLETSQVHFASGSLILLINTDYSGKIAGLSDLKQQGVKRIAIANPEIAPYGSAARQILLEAQLWEELLPKIVIAESVQQAYVYVISGNVDAGIVARSNLTAEAAKYDWIQLTASVVPEHWATVLTGSHHIQSAERFLDFLGTDAAREILENFGFRPSEDTP